MMNEWAHDAMEACHPYKVEVVGSTPTAPTTFIFGD